jgi:hypothetical protein
MVLANLYSRWTFPFRIDEVDYVTFEKKQRLGPKNPIWRRQGPVRFGDRAEIANGFRLLRDSIPASSAAAAVEIEYLVQIKLKDEPAPLRILIVRIPFESKGDPYLNAIHHHALKIEVNFRGPIQNEPFIKWLEKIAENQLADQPAREH